MPKKTNPAVLTSGNGQEPFTQANFDLLQTDPAPPPGDTAINPTTVLVALPEQQHDAGVDFTFMLASHVQDPQNAHPASALSVAETPAAPFTSDNVQGALSELASLLPPTPSGIGQYNTVMPLMTGVPDWGRLGLVDGPTGPFTLTGGPQLVSHIYPYYWEPPTPANITKTPPPNNFNKLFGVFTPPLVSEDPAGYLEMDQIAINTGPSYQWNAGGNTPRDPIFNVADVTYTGGGAGKAFTGAFTRSTGDTIQTYRVVKTDPADTDIPVVVTGIVAPADRGVLTIIHWPAGGMVSDFLAQTLSQRVVAAILLGQGIYGEGNCPTDGEPGGIFLKGQTNGQYDPYAWPGQATGQADLTELLSGLSSFSTGDTTTDSLSYNIFKSTSPYWNFDGRVSAPLSITSTVNTTAYITEVNVSIPHGYRIKQPITITGAAQIPNGTYTVSSTGGPNQFFLAVPTTGAGAAGGTSQRISGCEKANYPADGIPFPAQVRLGTVADAGITPISEGIPILGAPLLQASVRGGGNNENFFAYRLPCLDDYSDLTTGVKYTPQLEKPRYFQQPFLTSLGISPLASAGQYTGLAKDYYPHQYARFRHRFVVPTAHGEAGSYMLLHFKKEADFENLIVNGVWPTDDKLYSANITNVAAVNAGTEGLEDSQAALAKNLIDQTVLNTTGNLGTKNIVDGYTPSKGFFSLCASVFGDSQMTAPTITLPNYNAYVVGGAPGLSAMTVSGIQYFLPLRPNGVTSFLCSPGAGFTDLFGVGGIKRSFRTGYPDGRPDNQRMMTMPPVLLHFGDFALSGQTQNLQTPVANIWKQWQRFEFSLEALSTSSVGGTGPAAGDLAQLDPILVKFSGDLTDAPTFSADAKPHVFVRVPIAHSLSAGVNLANAALVSDDGNKILFHSTSAHVADNPEWGNFVTGGAGSDAISSVQTPTKDKQELFLDEVYRYRMDWGSDPIPAGMENLFGPGLPLLAAPIEVPVRAGVATAFGGYYWQNASWIKSTAYTIDLSIGAAGSLLDYELQVGGLPHRNPPITVGAAAPKPQAGILLYPKDDYSEGYRPNFASEGVTQFDYSVAVNDRSYVRAFDCSLVGAAGQPFLTLRFDGLALSDFAYAGGATAGSVNMAILAKVPGLTTWMDIGRTDGAGPSKQDPLLDGAGCTVLCPETFEGIDKTYGHVYSQVKINVGPFANLFESVLDPQCAGQVPLLIKVVYYDPAGASDSDKYDFLYDFNTAANNENAAPNHVRGLVGIQIVSI